MTDPKEVTFASVGEMPAPVPKGHKGSPRDLTERERDNARALFHKAKKALEDVRAFLHRDGEPTGEAADMAEQLDAVLGDKYVSPDAEDETNSEEDDAEDDDEN